MTIPDELTSRPTSKATRRSRSGLIRRILKNPLGAFSMGFLGLVVLVAIIGPWIAPYDPNFAQLSNAFQGPSAEHLLGTDSAGRDILSRLMIGARSTLLAAALAASVAVVIALPTGLSAGYFGGWFDGLASWATNILMSLPAIIVLLAASASLGKAVWISMTVFGVMMSAGLFRLTRTTVRAVRNELYVDAARVSGLSDLSIVGRHVLFAVRAPLVIQVALLCGVAISIQAGLEFLGLGEPNVPTWGAMLSEGFLNIYTAPELALWPGLIISLTVGSFIVLGSAIRDALEDSPTVSARVRKQARAQAAAMRDDSADASPPIGSPEEGQAGALLDVAGLRISYTEPDGSQKTVVSDFTCHVNRGEVVGVVGESGSGKSQSAFAILGLLPDGASIDHGYVRFDQHLLVAPGGESATSGTVAALRGAKIAYVPQEPMSNLDPNFTVGHQLMRPMMRVLGLSRSDARKRALELLDIVGIRDPQRTMSAYPFEISGGMAQRVLIAGAVSCKPDLLIADEPTTALDVTVQAEVLALLRRLRDELDMGVLLVTHNFGVVADICDRVVVMKAGEIVEQGDVRSVLKAPREAYTRRLLDSVLEGKPPMTMLLSSAQNPRKEEGK
ncbi:dipeptide/oligopeptide/nickel ABC transporter permease/ATP-binding protein [Microbacterium xanthum]|uniref:dipeptide/oligopeptide/nickel ABC transporter permease/ATP-binding protein n=1 Tax=Microbacterium xanthum TaxID=3079794 RepID=UPI002AD3746C|nr:MULTISPECIES: dipeptide/oligopeptide/nickel ABC transporter permease/ATP-binding protein [unclassified Microbacterium]MDZ8171165.1 dipeptide/oligopeptide/nickel ABC transporter permease/ATP-binding protein [Microbacterium sp. KSW-48]MDZ8201682.1 dipeptide/oligopeptide/nickel ABC transporter permease/ATP-binding protein [Microbacterium sp. SSW1-59]